MWILLTGPSDEKNPYADKVRDAYHNYMGLATLAANNIYCHSATTFGTWHLALGTKMKKSPTSHIEVTPKS